MNLYSWPSNLMKDHYPGQIIVAADNPTQAREAVRAYFAVEFGSKKYTCAENRQIDVDRMERDIAPEPDLHIRRVVFLHG